MNKMLALSGVRDALAVATGLYSLEATHHATERLVFGVYPATMADKGLACRTAWTRLARDPMAQTSVVHASAALQVA